MTRQGDLGGDLGWDLGGVLGRELGGELGGVQVGGHLSRFAEFFEKSFQKWSLEVVKKTFKKMIFDIFFRFYGLASDAIFSALV